MRIYDRADYEKIVEWCFMRDTDPPPSWSLPETGIMVENVAVGFLIVNNNYTAHIDFYISNPLAAKGARDLALDGITSSLINLAGPLGIRLIQCNTKNPAIESRAEKHGFKSLGKFTCFQKEL